MTHTEQRTRMRAMLAGSKVLSPASVFDPLSARVAESVGYELGMLAGSVASNTTLAAPDLIVITLTEFASQIRRIMRACNLSLLVDADHGYGNALNVMRTVQECEHAGVSALTIEDTVLPRSFGKIGKAEDCISTAEMVGKLKAAVAARGDPALVVVGRTSSLKSEGLDATVARVKSYAATGIDALFLLGVEKYEQVEAVYGATKLPIILGGAPATLNNEEFWKRGVRIRLTGHQPVAAAVKALHDTYSHLFNGGAPADLKSKIASEQEMAKLVSNDDYNRWLREFMQ